LRNHIHAAGEKNASRVGVANRNISLLRAWHVEPATGQQKELVHFDIVWKCAAPERHGVCQRRISAEQAIKYRLKKAPLQLAPVWRLLQRQRGEDAQPDRRIARGTDVQRIGDMVRFAETQR
jgi:hypothetical protein